MGQLFAKSNVNRKSCSALTAPSFSTASASRTPMFDSLQSDDSYHESTTATTEQQMMTVDDFELICVVGKGSFGKVVQVRRKKDGKIYAMKILRKSAVVQRRQVSHTKTERRVLGAVTHPFITKLRFAFQSQHKLYIVLDFFNGGELFYWLKKDKKFSEDRAKFYAAQILLALECLHTHNTIYRDLKPENLLLDSDGFLKVADFGLSKERIEPGQSTHTFCGTAEYLAPEILKGKGYGLAVDWWSFGTLLFEMLTGLPPFYNANTAIMYENILHAPIRFPTFLSDDAKDLLTKLLQRDHRKRLGCGSADADELKRHPFFSSIDFIKLSAKQVEPPFKPPVSDILDTNNIDEEFTRENPCDSPVLESGMRRSARFSNFTFVPAHELSRESFSAGEAEHFDHLHLDSTDSSNISDASSNPSRDSCFTLEPLTPSMHEDDDREMPIITNTIEKCFINSMKNTLSHDVIVSRSSSEVERCRDVANVLESIVASAVLASHSSI